MAAERGVVIIGTGLISRFHEEAVAQIPGLRVATRPVWNIPRSSAPKWNSPLIMGLSTAPAGRSRFGLRL